MGCQNIQFNLFPVKKYYLKLSKNQEGTLHLLEKNTKKSHSFRLSTTNKSFLGIIDGYAFKLVCPHSHFATLCSMRGQIRKDEIHVVFKLRRVPKIIMVILLLIFSLTFISHLFRKTTDVFSSQTLGGLMLVLMLAFVIPKMLFIMSSRKCLKILTKTLELKEEKEMLF